VLYYFCYIKIFMQIPQTFQPFPKSTIIVITDNVQAKLYHAFDREFTYLETLSSDYPSHENQEQYSMQTPGGMHSGEQSEKTRIISRDKLYHKLSKNLLFRLQKNEFETLVFTAPEEDLEELKESLHIDLFKRTFAWIPKNLTYEDSLDLVAHIQEVEY